MFERYYRELLNFLAHKVGDRELAADLVQESYARAYAASNKQGVLEPRALLYTTARNLVTDHYRRSAVRGENMVQPTGSTEPGPLELDAMVGPSSMEPDAILSGRQRLTAIEQVITGLPPRAREAFVLFKLDGLSRSEVAREMGIGLRTVETHLQVAMTALVSELQLLDGAPPTATCPQARANPTTRAEASDPR